MSQIILHAAFLLHVKRKLSLQVPDACDVVNSVCP